MLDNRALAAGKAAATLFARSLPPCRYYAQQKAIDTASTAAAKIEGRSRQREAQERQAEYALLQSRQQAR